MRAMSYIGVGFTLIACGPWMACHPSKQVVESAEPAPSEGSGDQAREAKEESLESDAVEEGTQDEPRAAPGKLTVVAKVGNQEVPVSVRVLTEDGSTLLAEGSSGEPLSVMSGELLVEASILDAEAIIDRPTMRQYVTLAAGQTLTEKLSFPRARVRVSVLLQGKLDSTAVVTLSKKGTPVAKLTSGNEEYVSISPGRYEASVKSQRAEVVVSEIVINEGATQSIPINVN